MTVHPVYLVLALILLWFPRNWLRHGMRVISGDGRRSHAPREERDPNDRGVKPLVEAAKSRNWVDWLRATVGAFGLTAVALVPATERVGVDPVTVACQGAALATGMLLQMVRMEGRVGLFAPIFYLQGMTFGVAGGLVGALAMIGSWALSPVLPGAAAILFVQGGITLSLGLLLQARGTEPVMLMVLTGITWAPVLVSVLLRKRLSASFDKRLKIVSRESSVREAAGSESKRGGAASE